MRLIAGVAKNAKVISVNDKTDLATRKSLISYSNPLGGMATNKRISEVKDLPAGLSGF